MKKLIFTILATVVLQSQVYSQLKNYNDNGKIKILTEKTTLSITEVETPLTQTQQGAALLAAAGNILTPVVDLVVKSVQEKVKKNALAYKGEFKCSVSGDKFYKNDVVAALPKLTMKRIIKSTDGTDQVAVEIELVPELSEDKTAFRYFVKDKCVYNYSIAKTKGDYDYIDLNIEINIKNIFINKGEYKIDDLRTTTINIPMIHVGKTKPLEEKVYSGWIPLPTRSTGKKKEAAPIKEETTVVKTNKEGVIETNKEETTVKKSDAEDYGQIKDNTGLYEIKIIATETNPYKIKAENKQKIIESSSESGTEILKAVIKELTKEKEDKEEKK